MAMFTSLTPWEERHLQNVHLILSKAEIAIEEFKKEGKDGKDANVSETDWLQALWLRFRYIVYDLYSVLDYTYYFLYCHFSHRGEPAPPEHAVQFGFPYKAKGVKISYADQKREKKSGQDETEKFVMDKRQNLCRNNPQKEEVAKKVVELICSLQPTVEVKPDGSLVEGGDLQVSEEGAKCLAMLRFYRNCVTHRDLILFPLETSCVQFNKATGSYELVKESEKREDTYSHQLGGRQFWIELPDVIRESNRHMPLLLVLDRLKCFVRDTCTKLLQYDGIPFPLPDGMFCALLSVSTL